MKLKFLLVIGTLVFLGAIAVLSGKLVLGSHTTVTGWLWSGTSDNALPGCTAPGAGTINCGGAGWINLNHTNPPPYTPGAISYGINIPLTDGLVTGEAWSSNLGWIDFAPTGGWPTTGCGILSCPTWSARREGNNLTGWARIVSIANAGTNAGAWDGWIKLSGPSYGVQINTAVTPNTVIGYGWSNELGWINFNGNITGSVPPPPPTYTLTVAITGSGSGTVNINPPNSNCTNATTPCTQTYPSTPTATVTLTALAAPGSAFVSWSGDCSGAGTVCTVSMTVNRSVTATFNTSSTLTADIKANGSDGPITIPINTAATITWTSTNATDCAVSPTGWTGTSNVAGNSTGLLTSSQVYTLNCTNSATGGSASDSVTVNVSAGPPPPLQPDLTIDTLTVSPSSPTPGANLSFSGRVINIGTANAGSTKTQLQLDIDDNNIWDLTSATEDTNPLDPYPPQFDTESWPNFWTATAGTHRFKICADVGNEVTNELSEVNNCPTLTFAVTSGGGGGGPLNINCSGSPNPAYLSAGGAVTWRANVVSGTGPYTYSWGFAGLTPLSSTPVSPQTSALTQQTVTSTYNSTSPPNAAINFTVTSGANSASCSANVTIKRFKWREIIPFF